VSTLAWFASLEVALERLHYELGPAAFSEVCRVIEVFDRGLTRLSLQCEVRREERRERGLRAKAQSSTRSKEIIGTAQGKKSMNGNRQVEKQIRKGVQLNWLPCYYHADILT
jgi:hypothetical protein